MLLDYLVSKEQMNDRLREAEMERLGRELRQANKQNLYQKVSNWLNISTTKRTTRPSGKLSYEA